MKTVKAKGSLARQARTVSAALLIAAAALSCESLWVTDAPRPSLKENDTFDVFPACPDLAVDPNAIDLDAQPSRIPAWWVAPPLTLPEAPARCAVAR
jgi:hypothetical protein